MTPANFNNQNDNNTIENLSGKNENNEYVAQTRELVLSKDKIMDLLKRIGQRKARIYHNERS